MENEDTAVSTHLRPSLGLSKGAVKLSFSAGFLHWTRELCCQQTPLEAPRSSCIRNATEVEEIWRKEERKMRGTREE